METLINLYTNEMEYIDSNGNEWIWIEVPKTSEIYKTSGINIKNFTQEECEKIYYDLKIYASSNDTYQDTWYNGCGIVSSEKYNSLKNSMIKSIYINGGFYIGKYEVGSTTFRTSPDDALTKPVIQRNMYPYNYVTCAQAQELAEKLSVGGRDASLMFGIQWDLICKYLENTATNPGDSTSNISDAIRVNSIDFGNYGNANFLINSSNAKYSIYDKSIHTLRYLE